MKICPCKDCEIRHMMCHSICKNYIEWKGQKEEVRKKRYLDKEIVGYQATLAMAIRNRRRNIG